METFTPVEYLMIDIANNAGLDLDKQSWQDKIQWVKDKGSRLEELTPTDPKVKYLYSKAVDVYRNLNKPTGFIMGMDSTNSGAQIMSVLGKCRKSALTCNVINTGNREDLYGCILNKIKNVAITRDEIKSAVIPMMYGSVNAPKELFGEGTKELKEFLLAVEATVPILGEMKGILDTCWNDSAEYHQWTMPDGHVVRLPTLVMKKQRLELELNGKKTSFTYQYEDIGTSENCTPLLAHCIHATDAYVMREMVRRCDFELLHIHDAIYTRPKHMNTVREVYRDILIEIAQSNLLEVICSQLVGSKITIQFTDPDLWKEMIDANYMLS